MIGSNMFLFIRKSTCFNGIYVIQAFYLYVLSLLFSYLVSLDLNRVLLVEITDKDKIRSTMPSVNK
jgi:hypothetical protein